MAEVGMIQQVDINHQLEDAYLSYAMSVIVSRALPDVRDGLKPVHRRILYAMYDMGLTPDRPFKKSARIVGEVLGKYHPHSDVAVYDSMVRMAQEFSMRYMLVEGQGNFGSVDGDNAAAMRYTEARLMPLAMEMVADIEKETVPFSFNFDGTLKEPGVLPAMLPNLLINGADGIAVGMSTKIPPHNISEICDALDYMIQRWATLEDIGVEDLMRFVQGPDFPTGGIIYRYRDDRGHNGADTIQNAYATGRGRIVVQAKTHVEATSRNRSRIVVTELPFQTNKANLIERIAELVRDGKLEGITDLRDESDRRGMRVVIELTRTVEPAVILAQLFKLTPLRQTFGVIMLALVEGQPRMLSLKRALQLFVEHRQEVVRRRTLYDLARARARAHILEGLRIALDHLDEVIATIRRSQRVDTARQNLISRFKLSEMQAQAILDMRLARLAALERKKIEEEYQAVQKDITYLEGLLADPTRILSVIRDELKELKRRYADPRRTQIITDAEYTGAVVAADSLIPDSDVLITISHKGEIQRWLSGVRRPRSGAEYSHILTANNRSELLILSTRGRAWKLLVHQLPEKTGQGRGESLGQLLTGWDRQEGIAAAVELPTEEEALAARYLIAVTRAGRVIRVGGSEAARIGNGTLLANVEKRDELLWATSSDGSGELYLVSARGQAIRFAEEEVRPTGMGVQGVWGMKLEEKEDAIVGAGLSHEGDRLLLISETGLGKQSLLADYPTQGRYGKGVRAMNLDARSGRLAVAAVVTAESRATVRSNRRVAFDIALRDLPTADRYHQGQSLAALPDGQSITELLVWREARTLPKGVSGTDSASDPLTDAEPATPERGKNPPDEAAASRKGAAPATAKKRAAGRAPRREAPSTQQLTLSLAEPPPAEPKRGRGRPKRQEKNPSG